MANKPNSTKATVQATLQPASTSKYLASDKVKRMGSARPLNAKKDNSTINSNVGSNDNNNQGGHPGPKSTGSAPMRKIAPDQFYKQPTTSLTPSQSQPANMANIKNKFERY